MSRSRRDKSFLQTERATSNITNNQRRNSTGMRCSRLRGRWQAKNSRAESELGGRLTRLKILKSALLVSCAVFPGVAFAQETLQTIEVVGISPVPGGEIDIQKVPSNVE